MSRQTVVEPWRSVSEQESLDLRDGREVAKREEAIQQRHLLAGDVSYYDARARSTSRGLRRSLQTEHFEREVSPADSGAVLRPWGVRRGDYGACEGESGEVTALFWPDTS